MSKAFFDRLAGRHVAVPGESDLPGRHVVEATGVLVDGVQASPGDLFMAPDETWTVRVPTGESRAGHLEPAELIGDLERGAVEAVAGELRGMLERTGSWEDVCELSPLLRDAAQAGQLTAGDTALNRDIPSLQAVFHCPHHVLDALVERTPASRARRLAPGALQHLAAHSEDWERRTVTGVQPRRVLALRPEARFDVYENRVAARLSDLASEILRHRANDLRQLAGFVSEVEDFQELMAGGHWLARRLSNQWGDAEEQGLGERVRRLLEETGRRWRTVEGLRRRSLYRAVPRRARVARLLHATNLLSEHRHYRRVARLWNALHGGERPELDAAERYAAAQRSAQAYDAYCLLLLLRTLRELGLGPADGTFRLPLKLRGELGSFRVDASPRIGIVVRDERVGDDVLSLIPLAVSLTGTHAPDAPPDADRVRLRAHEVLQAIAAARTPTAVCYPGVRTQREALGTDLARLINGEFTSSTGGSLVPASPADLLSQERIERFVRQVLLARAFREYPPQISCRRDTISRASELVAWLSKGESRDYIYVTQPPADRSMRELKQAIEISIRQLRPRQHDHLRAELTAIPERVRATQEWFSAVRRCPTCTARGTFRAREAQCWLAECGGCGSRWGLNACGECGARVPFIALQTSLRQNIDAGSADWVDTQLGRDALAPPCRIVPLGEAFVCTSCGVCPEFARGNCARCDGSSSSQAEAV